MESQEHTNTPDDNIIRIPKIDMICTNPGQQVMVTTTETKNEGETSQNNTVNSECTSIDINYLLIRSQREQFQVVANKNGLKVQFLEIGLPILSLKTPLVGIGSLLWISLKTQHMGIGFTNVICLKTPRGIGNMILLHP